MKKGYGLKTLSKSFMAKFYNTQNPYIKFKRRYHYRMVTEGGEENKLASYFWTLGTFYAGNFASPDGPKNFDQSTMRPTYMVVGQDGYTDLAYARNQFWDSTMAQVGDKAYISRNDMIFRFRNNMNIRCYMTVTYFIPRKGINMRNDLNNGQHYLEALKTQSNVTYSPVFDWRSVTNVTQLFKVVVKKFNIPPGGIKALKFKCGGLPFLGNNNRFDETQMTTRFTRFMHILAYGDLAMGQSGVGVGGRPLYASENIFHAPVNIAYQVTHRLEGKKISNPNTATAIDLTTNGNAGGAVPNYNWENGVPNAGPVMVPIGGTHPEFVLPETTGMPT